jgi:2-methylisocitrate lyase-like PEP mutase family enzyme
MLEGGRTPLLQPSELEDLGFHIVIYGISPLIHAVRAMQEVLSSLSKADISFAGGDGGFEEYKSIVGFNRWADIENRYQLENRPQFEQW